MKYTSRKRKLDEDLQLEKTKRMKIDKENLELQKENNRLMEQNIRLSKKLIKKSHAILSTPKHRNMEYSKSYARRIKKQRTQNCKDALLFLGQNEYTPITLKVK